MYTFYLWLLYVSDFFCILQLKCWNTDKFFFRKTVSRIPKSFMPLNAQIVTSLLLSPCNGWTSSSLNNNFAGYSVPSGFVLWIMKEMPPPVAAERPSQSRVVTFVRDTTLSAHNPQWRTAVASSQDKVCELSLWLGLTIVFFHSMSIRNLFWMEKLRADSFQAFLMPYSLNDVLWGICLCAPYPLLYHIFNFWAHLKMNVYLGC